MTAIQIHNAHRETLRILRAHLETAEGRAWWALYNAIQHQMFSFRADMYRVYR